MDYEGLEPVVVVQETYYEGKIRYRGWTYEWVYEREPDNAYYFHNLTSPDGNRHHLDYTGGSPLPHRYFALWVDIGGIDRSIVNKNGPLDYRDMQRFAAILTDIDVDSMAPDQMKMAIRLAVL